MKASEIRIGNLVTINNTEHYPELKGIPMCVESITKTYPDPSRENSDYALSFKGQVGFSKISQFLCFIEPITLDEDWLFKFGFTANTQYGKILSYGSPSGNIVIDYNLRFFNPYLPNIKPISYVHTFQNACFYLGQGEELVLQD